MIPPSKVRLVPTLSIAALRRGLDKELAIWYCLRAINCWGSGVLELELAMEALIQRFSYSRSTAYRHLSQGEGRFWVRVSQNSTTVVKMQGLKMVCEYLDTCPSSRVVEVPATEFKTMRQRRSWLYASFHQVGGNKKARPISRASLEDATGVSRRQQQRYDKITSTKKVAQFAVHRDNTGNIVPALQIVVSKSGQYTKQRRLGNVYYSTMLRVSPGMTRRIRKELRGSLIKGEAPSIPKRFYLSARAVARRIVTDLEAFLLVKPTERVIPARIEWEIV